MTICIGFKSLHRHQSFPEFRSLPPSHLPPFRAHARANHSNLVKPMPQRAPLCSPFPTSALLGFSAVAVVLSFSFSEYLTPTRSFLFRGSLSVALLFYPILFLIFSFTPISFRRVRKDHREAVYFFYR